MILTVFVQLLLVILITYGPPALVFAFSRNPFWTGLAYAGALPVAFFLARYLGTK